MFYSYWFVNFWCWANMIAGIILGAIGWHRYGDKIKNIWKNLSK